MLNKEGKRELAYVVKIDDVKSIAGADRVELAVVGGWTIMVRKGQFKPNDFAIYFEIDSKVPAIEPFMFLESKHFAIKTQKYFKGTVISQGLLMSAEDFGWEVTNEGISNGNEIFKLNDGLTEKLGITYYEAEDNKRKADSMDKYKKMAQRHHKIFKLPIVKKIMKYSLGRKIMFFFFGKKTDKKTEWPSWVKKTDEERCQNLPQLFTDPDRENKYWIATEKIDGTSTTFSVKRKGRKFESYVCSRNVVFNKPDKECYYETNVYLEMENKYNIISKITEILKNTDSLEFVTLQGETYGGNIQKRDYSTKEHDFATFNLIFGYKNGTVKRFNPVEMQEICKDINIPCVPIIDAKFKIPATCAELLEIATGISVIDSQPREGLVFRSPDGVESFKAVSNEFLCKYHS